MSDHLQDPSTPIPSQRTNCRSVDDGPHHTAPPSAAGTVSVSDGNYWSNP